MPLISTTAADNANDNNVNSDPYTGAAAALVVDVSSLRITAPTSFEESGFPSASSGAGSPADGGRRGGWDHTRSSPADFGPPSSSRCGSGGGGGGDHRNPGDKTAATSPTAGGMDEYGGGSRRKGKPWSDDGPAMHERGRTHKSRRKRQQQPQPVRFRGSPPQSPASAQARAAFGFNVPSTAAYHTSYVGNSTATGGDDVGGAAVGGGGGSGGDLSTFGGHGVADVSFSSVASSEPRYHCLRSGSGRTGGGGGSGSESDCISPIMTGSPLGSLGGASSPVWVHMLGMSGDKEGEVVEAEAKSRGRIDTCQQRDGLHDRHREVGSASAGGMRAVVMAGGQGRQSNGEDGDGTKHLRDIGSPGVGDGVSVPGCGLRVEVAESESSWWALSDESV